MQNSQKTESQEQKLTRIKAELANVPAEPGVYLWKDVTGEVIYVGKAKQLRARMRQYVNFQDSRAKIPQLVEQIHSFEYIVTANEHESLVLEKNLINQYSPYFNADFKDDKSYPFISITKGDVFPAIKYTREKHKRGSRYFGPFTDSRAARKLIDIARKVVPLCSVSCAQWRTMNRKLEKMGYSERDRKKARKNGFDLPDASTVMKDCPACFDAHVGLGPGACSGSITEAEYAYHVERIERFLSGNRKEFLDELTEGMQAAAEALDFERAARLKARIDIIQSQNDRQHVVTSQTEHADVIGIFREETIAGVHVFQVREGLVLNSNEFILNRGTDVPDEDLLRNFLLRYYDTTTSIPHEVVISTLPEDADTIAEWLTEKLASPHGAKVHLIEPQRGERAELIELAERNAKHTLMRYKVRTNYDDKRINSALAQLESALALDAPPMRIECFDISTLHGAYTVASMVVFTGGKPDKNQYRRFKIRAELDEANDFLCMQEVMRRRYDPARMEDERFGSKPDLVIVDGGKPQLHAAQVMLEELGLQDIPLVGLAKRDEELFVTWQDESIVLPSGSASLYLVKQVRDEAHRFAITFHRELRGKGMSASLLDEVPGLGPVRKKAIMKHFKSMRALRRATLEEIASVKSLPRDVAQDLFAVIAQYNNENPDSISAEPYEGNATHD